MALWKTLVSQKLHELTELLARRPTLQEDEVVEIVVATAVFIGEDEFITPQARAFAQGKQRLSVSIIIKLTAKLFYLKSLSSPSLEINFRMTFDD